MPAPVNILLIRIKAIGDVVLTLPAVAALRENYPSVKITFLTSQENTTLLQGFKDVDEVIPLERAALRSKNPCRVLSRFFSLLRRLRAGKFDLVVDFQSNGESAWLTRMTGAKQRWGSVYNPGQGWAYTRRVARLKNVHPADGNLELLRQCGLTISASQNKFILPDDALATARKFFTDNRLNPDERTLFLQPFTSSAHKNWPLKNYIELAMQWQARGGQIIFGGGPDDRDALRSVTEAGFIVSAGVPLLVTGGLLKLSTLAVGGDTGAMHLAVALGRRVVMLMHARDAGSPYPFGQPGWAIIPAKTTQMSEISLATVWAECERIVNAPTGSASC
ncbi:MAG: glycosyltransferase family 9 protein [Limisphaerales bacterium]